jgi:hypothetical protein
MAADRGLSMFDEGIALDTQERLAKTRAQAQGFVVAVMLFGVMSGPLIDRLQQEMIAVAAASLSNWSLSLEKIAEANPARQNPLPIDGA